MLKNITRVIQRISVVPYTNEDIKEATDEIKNSVAAIDKALRAMYNFTFHQVDSADTLVRTLLTDGANRCYDALQAFPHIHDVQRWGRLTLQRLHNNSRYHSDSDRDGIVVVKISNRSVYVIYSIDLYAKLYT